MGPEAADLEAVTDIRRLGTRETAALLGVHRRTLERMVQAREFPPPMRTRGKSFWTVRTVRTWIESKERKSLAGYRKQA